MEGFVCDEENFKLYSLLNREPVKVLKEGGDVVYGADGELSFVIC